MTLALTVTNETLFELPNEVVRLELIAACAVEAAGYVFADDVEINLCCVDEAESARLNNAYRGKNAATNVLSFVAGAEVPGLVALGDLVVCLPVVEREATEQGKTSADHLAHMVVHGVLHLLGFDHIGDDEAESMEAIERRVLAGFGIADPYRAER